MDLVLSFGFGGYDLGLRAWGVGFEDQARSLAEVDELVPRTHHFTRNPALELTQKQKPALQLRNSAHAKPTRPQPSDLGPNLNTTPNPHKPSTLASEPI